ncbi:uncharacterized membrane protein At3g27390 isoform X1 [Beta vulgaris subsp. vulgaris]|uniref:uncharacterized membrane protein At3g27390 isoform X1 n=2 Tax=Beta vulgaris subsp. vulgaris TaxID=3555 RepID=UPI0020371C5B|nr:uncharacterized membrane protein At3g27390 isoform X1 [Beta vulgaris subsp. vulgaris]
MQTPKNTWFLIAYFIAFLPVFMFLFLLGFAKGAIISPFVFLIIAFGDTGVVIGLWPLHLVWSIYCLIKTRKFGPYMKCLLILLVPIPIAIWTVVGVTGSAIMGIGYGYVWPVMETFKAVSKEGESIGIKLIRVFTDGTWNNLWGACTIVRDFADFSFHSYFSVMDELLDSKGEEPIELKVAVLPGCVLSAILGIVVDVPIVTIITIYKTPILLFKGWQRLIQDLIGREGPFLETFCVPFAGLWILLWPVAVFFAMLLGVLSSLAFGCYAAVVAYEENSTKRGLLYVIASASIYDEYTNDLLYLQEGSCFPRPRYRDQVDPGPEQLPLKELRKQPDAEEPLIPEISDKANTLQAKLIWDSLFKAYEEIGVELFRARAIGLQDLESWKHNKNKIFNIGIPAYAFLECFLRSIKNSSPGFIIRDNVEITGVNRPEGRLFDWLYEPMCIMKEQVRHMNLTETEELYFYKHCLYSGDVEKVETWQNGGIPPSDEIRRGQMEGISRRLLGLCLNLSRLPTARRRILEVVKNIEQEVTTRSSTAEI